MNQFWTGILGGLIGSTLTVVITKLLEIFAAQREHRFTLAKQFFDRKLAAAEAAMTQSGIIYNALSSVKAMFDRLATHANNPVEASIQQTLQKQVADQMAQANNASLVLGNSLALYFDAKHAVDQNALMGEVFASMGAIGPLLEAQNTAVDAYHAGAGKPEEQQLLETAKQSVDTLDAALRDVSARLLNVQTVMQQGMLDIRADMRRYEY